MFAFYLLSLLLGCAIHCVKQGLQCYSPWSNGESCWIWQSGIDRNQKLACAIKNFSHFGFSEMHPSWPLLCFRINESRYKTFIAFTVWQEAKTSYANTLFTQHPELSCSITILFIRFLSPSSRRKQFPPPPPPGFYISAASQENGLWFTRAVVSLG